MRRHMALSILYPICNVANDTWRHALLDCNMAKIIWALWGDDVMVPMNVDETPDVKTMVVQVFNTLPNDKFVEVLVTLWAIWWAHCKAIHEQEFQSPFKRHIHVKVSIRCLKSSCYVVDQGFLPWCCSSLDSTIFGARKNDCGCSYRKGNKQGSCSCLCAEMRRALPRGFGCSVRKPH